MSKTQQPPITAQFKIKRKALLYDIENYSFLLGNVMPEDAQPAKHQLMDVAQKGNIDVVSRMLDLAYSECQNILFPHVKDPITTDKDFGDDFLTNEVEAKEYIFALQLPAEVSSTTIIYLKKLIHEYMVCKVMVAWLTVNNVPARVDWEVRLEDVTSKIRSNLTFRCKRVRRALHPFG